MIEDLPSPPPLTSQESLFLDFDGTLVEFVAPDAPPAFEESLRRMLLDLSARLDGRLAIVSGRSLDNLADVIGIDSLDLSGSHGHEHRSASGGRVDALAHEAIAAVHCESRDFARAHDLVHEAKPAGVTLHYRGKPDHESKVHSFAESLARRHGFQLLLGSMVAEVRAPGSTKGDAVRRMMAEPPFRQGTPVFVGDDVTDEDGFAAASSLAGYGILVGSPRKTRATYRLANVSDVIEWLRA